MYFRPLGMILRHVDWHVLGYLLLDSALLGAPSGAKYVNFCIWDWGGEALGPPPEVLRVDLEVLQVDLVWSVRRLLSDWGATQLEGRELTSWHFFEERRGADLDAY